MISVDTKKKEQVSDFRNAGCECGLSIRVSHITHNWRGKPLRTFETIVELIGNTRTAAGLCVKAQLDQRKYPTGETVTKAQMEALSLKRDDFHGDWNYEFQPHIQSTKLATKYRSAS